MMLTWKVRYGKGRNNGNVSFPLILYIYCYIFDRHPVDPFYLECRINLMTNETFKIPLHFEF